MKKLLLFCLFAYFVWSCSLGDDTNDFNYEFVPIESVIVPDTLVLDSVHTFEFTYKSPSTCHAFHDIYYLAEDSTRTVAVINIVFDNTNCETLEDNSIERTFDFKPLNRETYIFKFWQGLDENDEDQYLIYEIPVAD